MPDRVDVTVFIPTKDAGPGFVDVLDALDRQRTALASELLVIDSGSRDGTAELAAARGARVVPIAPESFDHGATRNHGVREARGEFVVLLTQDAVPADDDWLDAIVSAVRDEPGAAGAYCRQRPRPDCDPFIRDRLSRWNATQTARVVQTIDDPEAFWALEPLERLSRIAFDNVASCVRRSVVEAYPFERRRFGEDIAWSRTVMLAGHAIVFEPRACVVHSHDESIWQAFRRVYMDHQNLHELLGVSLVADWRHLIKGCWGGVGFYGRIAAESPGLTRAQRLWWRLYGIPYGAGQVMAQYLGPRSTRWRTRSRLFRRLDRWIVGRG